MKEKLFVSKWTKLNQEFMDALNNSDSWFEIKKIENSDTLNEVISDMISREKLGLKKYGTTIDRDDYDLKDWLQHALEEAMDSVLYLKKAIQQLENKNK